MSLHVSGHISQDARINQLEYDLATAKAELARRDALEIGRQAQAEFALSQWEALRKTANRLHRRLQQAESIISQAKLVENRPQGPVGRSLGRALANYAAAKMKEDRDRWKSACEQRTNERNRLGVEIDGVKLRRDQWKQLCLETIAQINNAEDRYPMCPCGQIVFESSQRMPK